MIGEVTIDTRGLSEFVSNLSVALIGTGQAGGGDLHKMLRAEAGQLAWEIGEKLGPKKKEGLEKSINRDLSKFLSDKPRKNELNRKSASDTYADFTWLYSGPNYLVGINNEDIQLSASPERALQYLRVGQKTGERGEAYVLLGKHGRQDIFRLNRTWVKPSAKRGAYTFIRDTLVGELRASFVASAIELVPAKLGNMPQWVMDKVGQVIAKGKSIFDMSAMNHPTEPYIEFGSTAPGVQSNPILREKIAAAVESRKYIMADKVQKILSGYAYDYKNGGVFKPAKEDEA